MNTTEPNLSPPTLIAPDFRRYPVLKELWKETTNALSKHYNSLSTAEMALFKLENGGIPKSLRPSVRISLPNSLSQPDLEKMKDTFAQSAHELVLAERAKARDSLRALPNRDIVLPVLKAFSSSSPTAHLLYKEFKVPFLESIREFTVNLQVIHGLRLHKAQANFIKKKQLNEERALLVDNTPSKEVIARLVTAEVSLQLKKLKIPTSVPSKNAPAPSKGRPNPRGHGRGRAAKPAASAAKSAASNPNRTQGPRTTNASRGTPRTRSSQRGRGRGSASL